MMFVLASQATVDTTAPTFPTDLYQTAVDDSYVSMAWASSDNAGVTAQTLYWKKGTSFYSTISLTAGQTSYTKTGLSAGTQYSFYIRAFDGDGNATNSSVLVSTTGVA